MKLLSNIQQPKELDLSNIHSKEFKEEFIISILENVIHLLNQGEYFEIEAKFTNILHQFYQKNHKEFIKKESLISDQPRYFSTYYRITLFSPLLGSEDGQSYIYKMSKFAKLYQVVKMVKSLISDLAPVELIDHSGKVDKGSLSHEKIHVQITNVKPYFTQEELEERKTLFEKNHNISRFFFMTPFTENGKGRKIEETYLKRTILTTEHSFPFISPRSLIVKEEYETLTPIEGGIRMIEEKNKAIQEALNSLDIQQIQLQLQGSVVANVNGGPIDVIHTFLGSQEKYPQKHIELLKFQCKIFLDLNQNALEQNQKHCKESNNHLEFHQICSNGFLKIQEIINKYI